MSKKITLNTLIVELSRSTDGEPEHVRFELATSGPQEGYSTASEIALELFKPMVARRVVKVTIEVDPDE